MGGNNIAFQHDLLYQDSPVYGLKHFSKQADYWNTTDIQTKTQFPFCFPVANVYFASPHKTEAML
jgi:hypothetical protein